MALTPPQQLTEELRRCERALIALPKAWTPDGVAAALALQKAIVKLGKSADVVCDGFAQQPSLAFLDGMAAIKPEISSLRRYAVNIDTTGIGVQELSYEMAQQTLRILVTPKTGELSTQRVSVTPEKARYDLIIAINAPDLISLGAAFDKHADFFQTTPLAIIDHDPASERFGKINLVDITASSCCEIVYDLFFSATPESLDENTATALLTGIISESQGFRARTVTPKTLRISSTLMAAGANREQIVGQLYRTHSVASLRLWGRALARLKLDAKTKTAITTILRDDIVRSGVSSPNFQDIADQMILSSPDAEIAVIISEDPTVSETPIVNALIATKKYPDATKLVSGLRPQGNTRAAHVRLTGADVTAAEKRVLEAIAAAIAMPKSA